MSSDKLMRISEWLEGRRDLPLLITKTEQGDVDRVRMRLNSAGLHTPKSSPDEYTDGAVIFMRGEGTILGDWEESPLPQDTYVIPVTGLSDTRIEHGSVTMRTERGEYAIAVDYQCSF